MSKADQHYPSDRGDASVIIRRMPADDHPIDALQRHYAIEDAYASPVTGAVLRLLSSTPLPPPFDKIIETLKDKLSNDGGERIKLLLDTIGDETKKNAQQIDEMRSELDSPDRLQTLVALLLDGARKAEATRAKDRVTRIGVILANAAAQPTLPDADEVEEMMRIAMNLTDRDVQCLGELFRISDLQLSTRERIERYHAYMLWESGSWGTMLDGELDAVFSKLESFGLVSRLAPPNNLNLSADFQNRYVLLKKGWRFIHFIGTVRI